MPVKDPLPYQYYERHFPSQAEVFGGPNFFPEDLTHKLIDVAGELGIRKETFEFSYPAVPEVHVPSAINQAAQWSADLKCPVNTAVLKKYSLDDVRASDAHRLHRDPAVYGTQRIGLISLSGIANLTIVNGRNQTVVLPCLPRTALFLAPRLLHAITEPLNEDGVRHFLFLGYRA